MIDPRYALITRRLEEIGRVLAFSSGKGGVGKSICAVLAALTLSRNKYRTGLLDLDFQGASTHVFLGTKPTFPEEEYGIKPLVLESGINFMSFAAFSGDKPVPLRGEGVTNAILELLAITVWKDIDVLVIDMPPGIGDEVLDLIRLIEKSEFIVIARSSRVSASVVERLTTLLVETDCRVRGVIENMVHSVPCREILNMTRRLGVPLLGKIPYYDDLEEMIGKSQSLQSSAFAAKLGEILGELDFNIFNP